MLLADLKDNPLGTAVNEANLQTPFNATGVRPKVYVVNHSGVRTRRVVKVGVSEYRGADEALRESKDLRARGWNVDTLTREARRRDMNLYEDVIKPIVWAIPFDGRTYYIPPAKFDEDGNVIEGLELVPDGVWDFYLGNYDKMHSPDHREREDAAKRVALYWSHRKNPVLIEDDNGQVTQRDNPFGFLEFRRVIEREAPQQITREFMTAYDLVEG